MKTWMTMVMMGLVGLVLSGCGGTSSDIGAVAASPARAPLRAARLPVDSAGPVLSEGLRAHSGRIEIGMQVGGSEIFYTPGDGLLLGNIAREASVLLIGNNLKWAAGSGPDGPFLRPSRDTYDFSAADLLVNWAAQRGMKVRAHTLVWGNALPEWLTGGGFTRDQLVTILREHIMTVVGRYRGRIQVWDVVNEAFEWNGEYKDNFWLRSIGPEYIEYAFRWAHEADPAALLFINEDGTEGLGTGSDKFLQKVQALLIAGVPVHGIGLETHVDLTYRTAGGNADASPQYLSANIRRLGALGLQVYISEVDVRIPVPATAASLAAQAEVYRGLYQACAENTACTGFHLWGITDKWSWISGTFAGYGAALPLDENYAAKPAYSALLQAARAQSDKCLEWVGTAYSHAIRPARADSALHEGYYYRYFSDTRNYVAIKDGKVYYWDPATMPAPAPAMTLAECQRRAATS